MPPLELIVILAFAVYRLTRLITADTITAPAREAFFNWAYTDEFDTQKWLEKQPRTTREIPSHVPRGGGLRTWVYDLVTCDQCLGVWWASAVYVAWWLTFDVQTDVVEALLTIMAICGLQSLLAWAAGLMQKSEEKISE